jgi:sugar lactone lactonase YvrE
MRTSSSSVRWSAAATALSAVLAIGSLALFEGSSLAGGQTKPMHALHAQNAVHPAVGYWLAASDGGVFNDGTAPFFGSRGGQPLNAPVVGMAATPDGKGYWLAASDGGIFNYGSAGFYGSAGALKLNKPVVGMAATPDGKGYWLVASDGGVFNYGSAGFYSSAGALRLNKPVVGMAATPDGKGYWLVASDGGIFNYGSAGFYSSAGALKLNKPVVGMAATPDGKGYWLVASDGGIFNYGDAGFFGSAGNLVLNKPVVGITASPTGLGYWLAASDGGIFNYGDATFMGSQGSLRLNAPVVGIATALSSAPLFTPQTVYWDLFKAGTTNQLQFAATPLTTSSPFTDISGTVGNGLHCSSGMTFDSSGRLWVISAVSGCSSPYPSLIQVFNVPITQSSVPVLSFTLPGTGNYDNLTFDHGGNLWVEDSANGSVSEFTGPFTSSGPLTAALTLTNGITIPSGILVDAAGDVFVANVTSSGTNSIAVFHTPVSNATVPTFLNGLTQPGGLIFDAQGNLYASNNASVGGAIVRYNANNLGNGATPNIVDTAGLVGQTPYEAGFAWDAEGNLYVADCGSNASVRVYPTATSQFSSSLAPSVNYTTPPVTATNCAWGIAIG